MGETEGRSDAANIIGGIIDSLQGIAYVDDRQVVEVHYYEKRGKGRRILGEGFTLTMG